MTALMLASNKGHLELVQDLIEGGADLDKQHPVRVLGAMNYFKLCALCRRQDGLLFSLLSKVEIWILSESCFTKEQKLKLR